MDKVRKVLGDRILIAMPEIKTTTAGGLLKSEDAMMEEAAELEAKGGFKAIASYVGTEVKEVKQGDHLELDVAHQLPVFTIGETKYTCIHEYHVACIVDRAEVNVEVEA